MQANVRINNNNDEMKRKTAALLWTQKDAVIDVDASKCENLPAVE